MQGLYVDPASGAAPTADFNDWLEPVSIDTANAPVFRLFGQDLVYESMSFDLANQVSAVRRVGREVIRINERAPMIDCQIEAPEIATLDFFAKASGRNTGVFHAVFGTTPGNIIEIYAPKVEVDFPSIAESESDHMFNLRLMPLPVNGDDEVKISFR